MTATTVATKPIFCRDCGGRDTFERDARNDLKAGGKVLWQCWRCRKCGHNTLTFTGGE